MKIQIERSQNCDTRSADKLISKEELYQQSKQHISDVNKAISWMIECLDIIGAQHDWSKLKHIDEFHKDFVLIQSGDLGDFKQKHWFKDLHLKERHHLNDYCPDDVNLFDVLERIADITMAGLARTGKIYDDTLSPEILTRAYKNTIELLKSVTEVTNHIPNAGLRVPDKAPPEPQYCTCKEELAELNKNQNICGRCAKPIKPTCEPDCPFCEPEIEELKYNDDLYKDGNIQLCIDKINELIRWTKR